jgi:DNA repair exonuclease SbcCD ATPase subunit
LSEKEERKAMSTNDTDRTPEIRNEEPKSHTGAIAALSVGLVLALAGDGYLLVQSNRQNQNLSDMRDGTQAQISKLGDATTTLLEQRMQALNAELKDAQDSANTAIKRARAEAQKQGKDISTKLEEDQQQVADQINQVKEFATTADSKITAVSSDVNSVKGDVTGVKDDVTGVKQTVATAQAQLEKTTSDLKRAMGDMGVMSGLIATNGKDLQALRELGERNYTEFDLTKTMRERKIGNVTIALRQTDPKRNRYSLQIVADDKRVDKKDRTINEPVQLYVGGGHQPYEIVVNQVKKDEVVGYLATPKVTTAQR